MRRILLLTATGISLITLAVTSLIANGGARAATTTIDVGDEWFCNPGATACMNTTAGNIDVTSNVNVGDMVTWNWVGQLSHTTTACSSDFSTCGAAQAWDPSP